MPIATDVEVHISIPYVFLSIWLKLMIKPGFIWDTGKYTRPAMRWLAATRALGRARPRILDGAHASARSSAPSTMSARAAASSPTLRRAGRGPLYFHVFSQGRKFHRRLKRRQDASSG